MTAERKANQSPTTAVILPYKETHGKDALFLYSKTGRTAQEWQENLINALLAVNDDGLYTHMNFGIEVPRRNGKNEIAVMRELYGLFAGERMCHTAHRTTTSNSAFRRLYKLLLDSGYEEHNRKKKDIGEGTFYASKQYGLECIEIPDGGSVYFRTRTNNGGLGEGFDLLIIDEAQEYTEKQQSALVYTVSDSKNPQTIFFGTPPTAISCGDVFPKMRKEVTTGGMKDAGWAEWSLDEIPANPLDVDLWYRTNPSLGTILTERNVTAEYKGDDIDFGIQRLGVWITYNQKSEISAAEWEALKVDQMPKLQDKRYIGVKYGKDGKNVAMSIAAKTTDGRVFVEVIDCTTIRAGNGWMYEYFNNPKLAGIAIDGQNGQLILAEELKTRGFKVKPKLPTVADFVTACAMFEKSFYAKTIVHTGQQGLADVVSHCEKRAIGSNGGFGYRSIDTSCDIAVMDSMILAHWLCVTAKEAKKQTISY